MHIDHLSHRALPGLRSSARQLGLKPELDRTQGVAGQRVFSFRGDRACHLNATYDLIGLLKQTGVYQDLHAGKNIRGIIVHEH
jgi:hypothetical protein